MKFKKQILDFFIKTNDEINQMKESHNDDQLKDYIVCGLDMFTENNKEISQMKFKRGKEINLNLPLLFISNSRIIDLKI